MPAVKRSVGLSEAAHALGLSYQVAHRLLLVGILRGRKHTGRWLVDVADLRRLARSPHLATRKRRSSPENRQ